MAKKPRKPALEFAAYLAVRMLVCIIQSLPPRWSFELAGWLAALVYRVNKRHREVAADNLRHAFPELAGDPARIDRLVRACYRHFMLMLIEIILLPRKIHLTSWRRYLTMQPGLRFIAPMMSQRPLLIATGHFGNWEMAGFFTGALGFKTHAIARTLDNPYLERFLKRFRQTTGQVLLDKNNDYNLITAALSSGGKVATLADQDAGSRGVFVDFFGRPASTHKALALMAIEYDAPLAIIGVPRFSEPMFYGVVCEDLIDPRDFADNPDAVRAMTQRYAAALERLIRRHPEQYFWLHRRWKTQPVKRMRKPVAEQAA